MTLAIFDIDGTLVPGSTERRFWRYLLRSGHQGPRQIAAYLWFLLRYLPAYGLHVGKKNKAYLAGLDTSQVAALAQIFVTTEVVPQLRKPVVQRLQQHLRRGDTVALLSGTLEPIARAVAEALGVQHVTATVCSERRGRYRASPPAVHPFGVAKLHIATQLAAELGANLSHATAYADSEHDLRLLEAVSEPVAVMPDARLLLAARAKNWDVIGANDDAHGAVPH